MKHKSSKALFKNQQHINQQHLKISLIILAVISCLTSLVASQDETMCYLKSSQCNACYSLCSNQNILPDYIKQCLIQQQDIDLQLNTTQFKNNITIIYLLEISVDDLNNCSLSNITIAQNDQQQENFFISIRNEYLTDNLTFPIPYKNSHATLLNAEFYFQNIYNVQIQRINFHGNIIRNTPTLSFYNVSNSFIEDSIFYNATISQNNGAAILIQDYTFITIKNTYFRENQLLYGIIKEHFRGGGAIYLTENSVLQCYNCSFFSNDVGCSPQGGYGGAIWSDYQSEIKFCQNCIFIHNKAKDGGAVQLSHNSVFSNCYNCIFDGNHGYDTGGAVSAAEYSILTMIINSKFINNKQFKDTVSNRYYGGGAVFLQRNSIFSYSQSCLFQNNSSTVYGGAIQINENSIYFSSADCIFRSNRADKYGGAISVHQYSIYSNSSNCIFEDNFSNNGGAIYLGLKSFYQNSRNCIFYRNYAKNDGGAIYILTNSVYSNSPYCTFNTNIAKGYGGAIWIYDYSTYLNSEKVNFINNSANFAGAIWLNVYSIYSNSSYSNFLNNSANKYAGAIYIYSSSSYTYSRSCKFYNNIAIVGGSIAIILNSNYQQSPYCTFDSNFAEYYGGAIFFDQSTYQDSSNCKFINNLASQSGGALYFNQRSFYKNSSNCLFINNQAIFTGGAITFNSSSSYQNSQNNSFLQNVAQNGGAFSIQFLSNYTDSPNCLFYGNTAQQNGGAILLSDNSSYQSSFNTTFISNFAKMYGGGIALEKNTQCMINLQGLYFENNAAQSGGGFYSDLSCSIKILQNLFIDNAASVGKGGSLYFDQIYYQNYQKVQTDVKNCLFTKNSALRNQGGSIFFKSDIYQQNITIENSSFSHNQALTGGAVSLQNVQFLTLINNTFVFNQAKQQGGGLYCQLLGLLSNYYKNIINQFDGVITQSLYLQLRYEIQDPFIIANNIFYQNQAQEVGGAISLDFSQSQQNIINKFYRIHLNVTNQQNITVLNESFRFINNTFDNNLANYGGAAIRINGFNISNIINNVTNGSCIKTQKIIQENNNTFTNNTSPLYKQFTPQNFQLYEYIKQSEILCSCIYGERLDLNAKNEAYFCSKCGQNTYMNQQYDNLTYDKSCIECPQGFVCPGGYENLKLKENFWSNTNLTVIGNDQSIQAFSCGSDYQKKGTCLGYDKCYPNNTICSKDSVCLISYMGPACQVCNDKLNYYYAGQNSCLQCESNTKIAFKMFIIITIILVLLYISIDSTTDKIQKQLIIKSLRIGFNQIIVDRNQLTALMRIFTNYFQNISYFFLLSVQVPDYIAELFLFIKSIGQPLTAFTNSFECLLSNLTIQGLTKKQSYLLLQFIWSLSLPTSIVLLLYLGSYAFKKFFKMKTDNNLYLLIAPIYIYLYLEFLPTLFYNSLSFLTCRTIAGKQYIIADSQYECGQPEYGINSIKNLSIALPIFLFQLFLPILLVCILVKFQKKNMLNRPVKISSCKYQLGYLYLGYKQSCYFWEFLRIFQRLMIASSFLVFYDYTSQKGALVVLTLFLYFLSTNYFKPNENNIVQGAEFYSNSVQIFTFVSAILLQKVTYIWFQYFFYIAISIANVIFILLMAHIMLKNARIKFIIFFMRYNLFARFRFFRDIIERHKQQRIIVNKWIDLKRQIGDILKLGSVNIQEIIQEKQQIKNNLISKKDKLFLAQRVQTVQGYQLFSEEAEEEQTSSLNQTLISSDHTQTAQFWSQLSYKETIIN